MSYNGSITYKTLLNKETYHFNLSHKNKYSHIHIKKYKTNTITQASLLVR